MPRKSAKRRVKRNRKGGVSRLGRQAASRVEKPAQLKLHALYPPLAKGIIPFAAKAVADAKDGKVKTPPPTGWFSASPKDVKESKGPDDAVAITMLKAVGRAGFGTKLFKLQLATPVYASSTVTTGQLLATFLCDASNASEWSAPAALFEEYKVDSGHLEFSVAANQNLTLPTSGGPSNYLQVVYDPEVGSAIIASTAAAFMTHEQRKTFVMGSNTGTTQNGPLPMLSKVWKFPFHVPKGAMFSQRGATTANVGDIYCSTAAPQPFGGIVVIGTTGVVVATPVLAGVLFLNVTFRNRF